MNKIIEQFEKDTGYTLTIKNGELFYDGNMWLGGSEITQLPDNLTIDGFLDLSGTDITVLPNNLTVGEYLELCNTCIKSLPDNLIVGGSLYLNNTGIKSLPNNLTVGGCLDLSDTRIKSLPNSLTVGRSLYLNNTGIKSLPDNLTVRRSLELRDTRITSLPDNLTVGCVLDIRDTRIKFLPDNLTVGDSLDLRGTGITSLPDSLAVDGVIDIRDTRITDNVEANTTLSREQQKKIHNLENMALFWERNGERYIKADGIFSVIDSHHGNVYKVHQLGQEDKPFYLITDGDNNWAHGATLAEAKADLIYKINDRDTSEYENLTLDDTLSYEEAIVAYRTITGACSIGTKDFIENRLPSPHKDKYTIRDIIKLTEKEYGGKTFTKLFKKNKKK